MNNIYVILILAIIPCLLLNCTGKEVEHEEAGNFNIGWATGDITPSGPLVLRGGRQVRVSEGIMDPITATALVLESGDGSQEKVILLSVDLVSIHDHLQEDVRNMIVESIPEISHEQIILNATHTHSAPYTSANWWRGDVPRSHTIKDAWGVELDVQAPSEVLDYISGRIAEVGMEAWQSRKPGGISYGMGHAVVGHNRLQVNKDGMARMYGSIDNPEFSHIEGYEDHSVHLLYAWDAKRNLTGVMINIAAPAQVSEGYRQVTADYWHDVRNELHKRLGDDVFVLPQISAAGDQSPHVMVESRAEERMQQLMYPDYESGRKSRGRRLQVADRIADAVTSVLPYVQDNIEWDPVFTHEMATVYLPKRELMEEDVQEALEDSEEWRKRYEQLLRELEDDPEKKKDPDWYTPASRSYSFMMYGQAVKDRYELGKREPDIPTETHVIRIDDIVIATNEFELFLDYGIRMKGRSPDVQTFVVQLTGDMGYLPTHRSISGGGYGSNPASSMVGPEGGEKLVEKTMEMIHDVWNK